jgi:hypothetical protein
MKNVCVYENLVILEGENEKKFIVPYPAFQLVQYMVPNSVSKIQNN